jgi:hypothetical protein
MRRGAGLPSLYDAGTSTSNGRDAAVPSELDPSVSAAHPLPVELASLFWSAVDPVEFAALVDVTDEVPLEQPASANSVIAMRAILLVIAMVPVFIAAVPFDA